MLRVLPNGIPSFDCREVFILSRCGIHIALTGHVSPWRGCVRRERLLRRLWILSCHRYPIENQRLLQLRRVKTSARRLIGGAHHVHDGLERPWLIHRQFGQNLAVQHNSRKVLSVSEAAVAVPVLCEARDATALRQGTHAGMGRMPVD